MSELPTNQPNSEIEQQVAMPELQAQAGQEQVAPQEPSAQAEVVIDGQVFKKTVLPAVTRKDALTRRGNPKRMPAKSRELTIEEGAAISASDRDLTPNYSSRFSEGVPKGGAPRKDAAWDGGDRVAGAWTPDDYYKNRDERVEHQE